MTKAILTDKLLTQEEFDGAMAHVRLRGESSLTRTLAHAYHVLGLQISIIPAQYNCTRQNLVRALQRFAEAYMRLHGSSPDKSTEMKSILGDKLLTKEEFEGAMTYVRLRGDSSLTRSIAYAFHVLGQPLSLIREQYHCTTQNAVRALARFAKGYERYIKVRKHLAKIGEAAPVEPAPAPVKTAAAAKKAATAAAKKSSKPGAKNVGAQSAAKKAVAKKSARA